MPSEKQTRAAIERTARQIKENSGKSYSESLKIARNSALRREQSKK